MPLPPLAGHQHAREALARAARADHLPQSLLVHGPRGIGKERFGLWLAQFLVCTGPANREPCGECAPCRWTTRLEHPDVHWFFPLPRPDGAATPDRLRNKLADARAAELQARRSDPLYVPQFDKAPAHFLAAILDLQTTAASRPAAGQRKVFVIGDAEAMVPQESSPEAANAFLKLLEEPPADTVLILTSSRPGALLPTIQSRVLPVRLAPLATGEVETFLEHAGLPPERARPAAQMADGAPGRALRLLGNGDGPGLLTARRERGRALLSAALADSPVARLTAAHAEAPSGGRGEFSETLDALARSLRELLAVAAGAEHTSLAAEDQGSLQRVVEKHTVHPLGVAAALDQVMRAKELAAGNINPQLILTTLLRDVQQALTSR